MKRLILSMVLALAAGVALAQTDFRHISYAEGLKAAKAEGKLLFVDFYTEWCGPCKMMANNVFPQKDVGDYMNAKFVCLKIDAEKGEGVELAERRNDFPAGMKERVMESLGRAYELEVMGYLTGEKPYDAAACGELEQEIAGLGLDGGKAFSAVFRLAKKYAEGDLDAYLTECEREYDTLGDAFGLTLLNALPTLVAAGDAKVAAHAVRFIRSKLEGMTVNEIYFAAMVLQSLEEQAKK